MPKNIIIGIGGTGLSAIRELRRLIAERYELGLADPAVAAVRFLYIDTNGRDEATRNWEVLGKDISLQEGEKVVIKGDNLIQMAKTPKDYPAVANWLPSITDNVDEPGEGAKGIRPYGRMIYEHTENKNSVHDKVIQACDSLNDALPHEPQWRFSLICSLSGGTGAGMFLPFAEDLIAWKVFERGVAAMKMRAFLVLPPLLIAKRHDRYHANAFAALKELNYKGVSGELPFSSTYLLEPVNEGGLNIGLDNLPLLIAQRIFLNIQESVAAGVIDGLMDNPNLGDLDPRRPGDDSRRRHARSFSSFGLSSISYPRETIARSVALRWATGVVSNWLQERESPQNVNQAVRNDLARLRLSRLHVNGDGDPFGSNDFPPHETELPREVDKALDPLQKKQIGPVGGKTRENIESGFRQVGIEGFYSQREKGVRNAAEYALTQVRLSVSRQVRDPKHGIRYAKEYLDELLKILVEEFKPEAASRFGEAAQHQVAVFQRNYGERVNIISQHESKLAYFDKEFARDKANMKEELKSYLINAAGYWSGKYATGLLDQLIPEVTQLRAELEVWHGKTKDLEGKLRGRLQVAMEGQGQNPRENGTVIFDNTVLERVANSAPLALINPAIEKLVTTRLAELEEMPLADLDLFMLGKQQDPEGMLENAAYKFILSAESPVNVQRVTLYDRFVNDYATPAVRRDLLRKTKALSGVFARSVADEVGRGQEVKTVEQSVTSIPNVAGRITKDGQDAQAAVRGDLEAIGVPRGNVHATQDVERIVFVSEKQAFPIRFVESVKELKKYYDKIVMKEVLHIDKREVDKLYDLFLLSDLERTLIQRAEEAFVLARSMDWIRLAKNQSTQKNEVRYEYEIPGKIGEKSAGLGPDWDIAFERFTQDAIANTVPEGNLREARMLLGERARIAEKEAKIDAAKWKEIFDAMNGCLRATRGGYPAGSDDPRYQRDLEIINRIVERYSA